MSITSLAKQIIRVPLEQAAATFGQHSRQQSTPRLWILMYHRILPQSDSRFQAEEPGMVITPSTLDMHLSVLTSYFDVVSLGDWVDSAIQGKPLPKNACAITFDDGWLDNYEYAFPVLQKHRAPATVFVVSHMMGTHQLFWPNRVAQLLQQPSEALRQIPWLTQLVGDTQLDRETQANAIYQLKTMPDEEIIARLDDAEQRLGLPAADHPSLMNWDQVRDMSASGLIEIGSHTTRHIRLRDEIDTGVLERELRDSKTFIEKNIGKPVSLFCYPNGDWTPSAKAAVKKYYAAAVTTAKGINSVSNLDTAILHRIGVHEDASATKRQFLSRLSGWPKT